MYQSINISNNCCWWCFMIKSSSSKDKNNDSNFFDGHINSNCNNNIIYNKMVNNVSSSEEKSKILEERWYHLISATKRTNMLFVIFLRWGIIIIIHYGPLYSRVWYTYDVSVAVLSGLSRSLLSYLVTFLEFQTTFYFNHERSLFSFRRSCYSKRTWMITGWHKTNLYKLICR